MIQRVRFPGANRIVRRTAGGVTIDWYAYRGKGAPRLASYSGASAAAAERAEADGAAALAAAWSHATAPRASKAFMAGLIVAYRESPAWKNLAPSTQAQWRRWLDQIHADFGDLSLKAMASKGARALVLEWRDCYADRPRTADYAMQVLSRLLSWAMDREMIERNVAEGVTGLYRADRSEQIWSPAQIEAACQASPAHVGAAIRLLAHTGLRLGDAVRLTWAAVDLGAGEIVWKTSKSRGRREAVVPVTHALRAILDAVPQRSPVVLTTSAGRPWSSAGALSHAIQNAAGKAQVERRTHDLRGTAATNLVAAGLSYPQVAMILAWTETEVERIARRYVSKGAVSRSIARSLNSVANRTAPTDGKGEK